MKETKNSNNNQNKIMIIAADSKQKFEVIFLMNINSPEMFNNKTK